MLLLVVIQLDDESGESPRKWESELKVMERNLSEIPRKKLTIGDPTSTLYRRKLGCECPSLGAQRELRNIY